MIFVSYKKKIFYLLPFLFLFIFFVIQFFGLRNHSQSFYFQDETEHVTLGWMISDYGKTLYKDLSTNHQPLPIFMGALFSKVINFQTLFQLIEQLRIGMWLFHFLTGLLIVYRFRYKGLLPVLFVNSLSYLFFGWYVLAESLVLPALIIIFLYLFEVLMEKRRQHWLDILLISFSLFWVGFNLLPLWPFVTLSFLIFFFLLPRKQKMILVFSLVVFLMLLFTQVPFFGWVEETFYHLIKYYLPYNKELGSFGLVKVALLPLSGLFYLNHHVARFISLSFIISIFLSWKLLKKRKVKLWQILLLFVLFMTLNNRVTDPRKVFFEGFHLYPFIAGLSTVFSYLVVKLKGFLSKKQFYFTMLVVVGLLINNSYWLLERKNKVSEHNIQYGEQQAYVNALNTIKDEGDRLLTGADGYGYINIVANLPLADRQNFHLDWAYRVPKLQEEFQVLMKENPPEFIYFKPYSSDYYEHLGLEENYIHLLRDDGASTDLYVYKDRAEKISEEQWQRFGEQRFVVP